VDGHAPFFIVIANHQVAPRPCATNWRFIGVVPSNHKGEYRMLRSRRALTRLRSSIKRRDYRGTENTTPPKARTPVPNYCSDLGSDLFFGDFASSRDTNGRAELGTPTFRSRMISFALNLFP
jgi:hypothetical protein